MTEILKRENNKVYFDITLPKEEVKKAEVVAYNKLKKTVQIPGFRKGHAPKMIIENVYGKGIFLEDAVNELLPKYYEEAIKELKLEVVDQPDVDFDENISSDEDVVCHFSVFVKPEIEIEKYKGLEVEDVKHEVTDEMLDEDLKRQQKMNARSVNIDDRAAAEHDKVNIDFEGFIDGKAFPGGKGENQDLELGSGTFIPGFEEQLIGAEIDKEVEVNVTFPKEYHSEELAGKDATFKCTVHTIKAKELPELDDEFASEVSECETMDAYRAEVKKNIKERKERTGKEKKENQAVDQAIENAQMDIPEAMIEFQVRQMADDFARRIQQQGLTVEQYFQFTGMTAEKMMEEMRPQAEKSIKTRLVLEAIVKAENIEVSDERVEEELTKMAEAYQMEVEKLKEFMGENEKKQIKEDLAVQEAITLLVNESVEG